MTPQLGIIGVGKVAEALAPLAYRAGYRIAAVYSRHAERAAGLAASVGAAVADSPIHVVRQAHLTLLTVPDDALADVVSALVGAGPIALTEDRAVIHTSGAHSLEVLAPLADAGLLTGSLHPAYPFTGMPVDSLADVAIAIEASGEPLSMWLRAWVSALGARAIAIAPGGKVLYHAALVFASNYTVTLYALAQELLMHIGAGRAEADAALSALVAGTVANIAQQGVPSALSGPLVRGDTGTINEHLRALEAVDMEIAALYRALARATLPLVEARGLASEHLRAAIDA
jgi:predicted short-subunit dehydrogenase-like oxidoreductase (DUF2520 family)